MFVTLNVKPLIVSIVSPVTPKLNLLRVILINILHRFVFNFHIICIIDINPHIHKHKHSTHTHPHPLQKKKTCNLWDSWVQSSIKEFAYGLPSSTLMPHTHYTYGTTTSPSLKVQQSVSQTEEEEGKKIVKRNKLVVVCKRSKK